MVKVINPANVKSNSSPGHGKATVKMLVNQEMGAQKMGIGLGVCPPGEVVLNHRHPESEQFYYILKGEITITSDLGKSKVKEGEAFFIGINESHGMINESKEDMIYLACTAPNMPPPQK
jgi:putative monooxygenase